MPRDPIPSFFFALTVIRWQDRFLLVHERKHGQLWYIPAGRVEPGETIFAAAIRETLEEAGIDVVLDGIIRVEHSPARDSSRVRVIFSGRPANSPALKSVPDDESLGAEWVTLAELGKYPLRGDEVRELFEYVARGGAIHPTSLLTLEGAPY